MSGSLYFLQEGSDGAIKIGLTYNKVRERWLTIQSHNSRELFLLGVIEDCTKTDELEWLQKYPGAHIRGEWFWPVAGLVAEIKAASKPIDQTLFFKRTKHFVPEAWLKVHRWMDDHGHIGPTFCKLVDCTSTHIAPRLFGRLPVSMALAKRIALVTKVVTADELMAANASSEAA